MAPLFRPHHVMSETLLLLLCFVTHVSGSVSGCGDNAAKRNKLILNPDSRGPDKTWAEYSLHQSVMVQCKFLHERVDLKLFWGLSYPNPYNVTRPWPFSEHIIYHRPYIYKQQEGSDGCVYFVHQGRLLLNVDTTVHGYILSCSLIDRDSTTADDRSKPVTTMEVRLFLNETNRRSFVTEGSAATSSIELDKPCRYYFPEHLDIASLGISVTILMSYITFLLCSWKFAL